MAEAAVRRASEEEQSVIDEPATVQNEPGTMADKKKRRTRSSSTKSTPKTTDDSDRISALEKSMEDRFSSMMTLFTQKLEFLASTTRT